MEINTDSIYPLCLSTRQFDFSQAQTAQREFDWRGYSADTTEADVLRLAAKALGVPKKRVKVLKTGGGWLVRLAELEPEEKTE